MALTAFRLTFAKFGLFMHWLRYVHVCNAVERKGSKFAIMLMCIKSAFKHIPIAYLRLIKSVVLSDRKRAKFRKDEKNQKHENSLADFTTFGLSSLQPMLRLRCTSVAISKCLTCG